MTDIDESKLVPTSTDMMVGMLGNTEKMVSSNKRWHYADHKGERDDQSDDLDVDAHEFINNSRKGHSDKKAESVFKKQDSDRNDRENNKRDDKKDTRTDGHVKTETETDYTATETNRSDNDTRNLSKKELMLLKLDMLRKLGELKQCGVHLSQNYNLDSDLDMMQYEYKLHHDIRSKQNSVQWMSHMMIGIIKGTEMFNDNYNPFDMKLAGLSNKISSDMHNYYAVLGDIYEKYNQPGKQTAPEMRLLLMISGAALSMQVNRIMPGIGGMANMVKSEQNLNDLRKKAEEDSGEKALEYVKKQHDAAAQKAADIKMIQEKELEFKRTAKLMDSKNADMRKFKENLILSSEAPSRDAKNIKTKQTRREEDVVDDEDETHRLTKEEIEKVRKMKYMEEQKHLEMLRKTAHMKSEMFRNNRPKLENNEKRKRDLEIQNKQLDDILNSVEGTSGRKQSVPKSNSKTDNYIRRSEREDTKSDIRSTASSSSTVSINPKIDSIMRKTSEKAKQESKKKYSEFSESSEPPQLKRVQPQLTKTPKSTSHTMPKTNIMRKTPVNSETKPTKVDNQSGKQNQKAESKPELKLKSKLDEIKFDEKIEELIANNDSDYDNISKDEISIGSRGKKSQDSQSKTTDNEVSIGRSSRSTKSKQKTSDLLDFGGISIGSRQKGERLRVNIGKK